MKIHALTIHVTDEISAAHLHKGISNFMPDFDFILLDNHIKVYHDAGESDSYVKGKINSYVNGYRHVWETLGDDNRIEIEEQF